MSDSIDFMQRVRVVLVRPQVAGNIGATARLMENFNAGPLVLVDPQADPASQEALRRSTHGEHRLHEADIVPTLGDGLKDVVFAIGASRRRGPAHQVTDLSPSDMASLMRDKVGDGDVAIVFGTEDNGLSREDLLACDVVVTIPAHEAYPTMNLSHAVAVCLYEAFLKMGLQNTAGQPEKKRGEPADLQLMTCLMDKLQHALLTIGYLRPEKPDHLMFPIRAILSRAELSRAEAQILIGLAQQIDEFAQYEK